MWLDCNKKPEPSHGLKGLSDQVRPWPLTEQTRPLGSKQHASAASAPAGSSLIL